MKGGKKILFRKSNMTQVWKGDEVVPVTILVSPKGGVSDEDFGFLAEDKLVSISALSKGRGFQGVVKRHGFHGGPQTHGQKNRLRAPGSIGATAPQRVIKGKKMAGHMGTERFTIKNIPLVKVDAEKKTVMVKGPVPGMKGHAVEVLIPENS